jgi:pyruvate dehydrogenase E1 component alpha subunit
MTVRSSFEINHTQFIDPKGNILQPLPTSAEERNFLVSLYKGMMLTRTFDAKAVALQRTGRLGTYPSSLGQEAVSVGIASAMLPSDVLVPSYREQGGQLWRGTTMVEILLYWGGDERGSNFQGPREDFPNSVPVGSHCPHATGVAHAFKIRGEKRAVVCVLGDGGTSKGDFYEALNLAGVWQLPVVFVITNNQWAISLNREKQTAAQTLAQKAIAAGITGEQVDGNDVIAVHHVVASALEKARSGGGAHVIEAVTYRLADHTTADDASRYRQSDAVSQHWKEDPLSRFRSYLTHHHQWTKVEEDHLLTVCQKDVEKAVEEYISIPPQDVTTLFDYTYGELPLSLQKQRANFLEERGLYV